MKHTQYQESENFNVNKNSYVVHTVDQEKIHQLLKLQLTLLNVTLRSLVILYFWINSYSKYHFSEFHSQQ